MKMLRMYPVFVVVVVAVVGNHFVCGGIRAGGFNNHQRHKRDESVHGEPLELFDNHEMPDDGLTNDVTKTRYTRDVGYTTTTDDISDGGDDEDDDDDGNNSDDTEDDDSDNSDTNSNYNGGTTVRQAVPGMSVPVMAGVNNMDVTNGFRPQINQMMQQNDLQRTAMQNQIGVSLPETFTGAMSSQGRTPSPMKAIFPPHQMMPGQVAPPVTPFFGPQQTMGVGQPVAGPSPMMQSTVHGISSPGRSMQNSFTGRSQFDNPSYQDVGENTQYQDEGTNSQFQGGMGTSQFHGEGRNTQQYQSNPQLQGGTGSPRFHGSQEEGESDTTEEGDDEDDADEDENKDREQEKEELDPAMQSAVAKWQDSIDPLVSKIYQESALESNVKNALSNPSKYFPKAAKKHEHKDYDVEMGGSALVKRVDHPRRPSHRHFRKPVTEANTDISLDFNEPSTLSFIDNKHDDKNIDDLLSETPKKETAPSITTRKSSEGEAAGGFAANLYNNLMTEDANIIAKANGEEMASPTKKQVLGAKKHKTDEADIETKKTSDNKKMNLLNVLNYITPSDTAKTDIKESTKSSGDASNVPLSTIDEWAHTRDEQPASTSSKDTADKKNQDEPSTANDIQPLNKVKETIHNEVKKQSDGSKSSSPATVEEKSASNKEAAKEKSDAALKPANDKSANFSEIDKGKLEAAPEATKDKSSKSPEVDKEKSSLAPETVKQTSAASLEEAKGKTAISSGIAKEKLGTNTGAVKEKSTGDPDKPKGKSETSPKVAKERSAAAPEVANEKSEASSVPTKDKSTEAQKVDEEKSVASSEAGKEKLTGAPETEKEKSSAALKAADEEKSRVSGIEREKSAAFTGTAKEKTATGPVATDEKSGLGSSATKERSIPVSDSSQQIPETTKQTSSSSASPETGNLLMNATDMKRQSKGFTLVGNKGDESVVVAITITKPSNHTNSSSAGLSSIDNKAIGNVISSMIDAAAREEHPKLTTSNSETRETSSEPPSRNTTTDDKEKGNASSDNETKKLAPKNDNDEDTASKCLQSKDCRKKVLNKFIDSTATDNDTKDKQHDTKRVVSSHENHHATKDKESIESKNSPDSNDESHDSSESKKNHQDEEGKEPPGSNEESREPNESKRNQKSHKSKVSQNQTKDSGESSESKTYSKSPESESKESHASNEEFRDLGDSSGSHEPKESHESSESHESNQTKDFRKESHQTKELSMPHKIHEEHTDSTENENKHETSETKEKNVMTDEAEVNSIKTDTEKTQKSERSEKSTKSGKSDITQKKKKEPGTKRTQQNMMVDKLIKKNLQRIEEILMKYHGFKKKYDEGLADPTTPGSKRITKSTFPMQNYIKRLSQKWHNFLQKHERL